MPENCRSLTLRDINNNVYPGPVSDNSSDKHNSQPKKDIQIRAKVLFGSVHAINLLKMEEKANRANKRF